MRWHVIPATVLVALALLVGAATNRPAAAYPVSNVFLPLVQRAPEPCSVAPTLVAPANGAQLDTLIPLFQWDNGAGNGITEYGLDISTDPSFGSRNGGSMYSKWAPFSGAHSWRTSWNLSTATTYYWRTYISCDAKKIYSGVRSFRTGSGGVLTEPPAILEPANGAVLGAGTPVIRWSPVAGALEYQIEFDDPINRSGYSTYTTGTSVTGNGLRPNTRYDLYVVARNDYAWGYYRMGWSFTTGPTTSAAALGAAEAGPVVVQVNEAGETVVSVAPPTE